MFLFVVLLAHLQEAHQSKGDVNQIQQNHKGFDIGVGDPVAIATPHAPQQKVRVLRIRVHVRCGMRERVRVWMAVCGVGDESTRRRVVRRVRVRVREAGVCRVGVTGIDPVRRRVGRGRLVLVASVHETPVPGRFGVQPVRFGDPPAEAAVSVPGLQVSGEHQTGAVEGQHVNVADGDGQGGGAAEEADGLHVGERRGGQAKGHQVEHGGAGEPQHDVLEDTRHALLHMLVLPGSSP